MDNSINKAKSAQSRTYDIVYIGLFSVLIAICSWISIPTLVPFTLQTFAIFFAVAVLGGKRGTISIVVYLLLGIIGLPVFSNFTGGPGKLLSNTGGYLIGFVFTGLIMWIIESIAGKGKIVRILSMFAGMIVYYVFGTIWFMILYVNTTGPIGLTAVLGWCVFPFIIPDIIKLAFAYGLSRRLGGIIRT